MDRDRWERVQALFHEAAARPRSEQRAFVEQACAGDAALAAEVMSLLDEDARSTVLDGGVGGVARELLGEGSAPPLPFESLGPYRMKRVLGEGGMGIVYLAEREDLGSLVAVKILRDAWLSPARRERFEREQRTLAQLDHPSIARLYDADALPDGTPWFAMEYVAGAPLTEHCAARRAPLDERLRLFRAVCEAVRHAHAHAIIHCDLKPSNMLVKPDGGVRLLDFGIAKHADPGDASRPARTTLRLMTPAYAAPEQLRGEAVGVQSDVYSLGVVLYELVAGRLPFDPPAALGAAEDAAGARRAPEPPSQVARRAAGAGELLALGSVSTAAWADLDVLCLTAMHGDLARRYGSVEALIRDLDHYARGEPLEARPDSLSYRAAKFLRRNRRGAAAAALALLAFAAVTVALFARVAAERDRASHQAALTAAINRFLSEDLLGRTDPLRGGKPSETLLEAIEQASPAIDRQFAGEPEIAARLHHAIARALDSRSDFAAARREYARAGELYRRWRGALSPDSVVVELQRAGMEARSYEAGSLPRARELLAAQEALAPRLGRAPGEVAVALLEARATIEVIGNDAEAAARDFGAALEAAERIPSFDARARRTLKERLVWCYVRLRDGARAEKLARELIAELPALAGPDSANVLRLRLKLAQAFLVRNDYEQAIRELDGAHPAFVAALGEDHEQTMQVLATRAQCEGSLGRWDDAIRDDLEVYRLAVRKQGPRSFYGVSGLADAALSQCRSGRFAEGADNARRAFEASASAFGDRAGLTAGVAITLATCLVGLERLDEASRLLDGIDVAAVSQLAGGTDWGAEVALVQGEIAYLRGDDAGARRLVRAAEPAFARPDADAYQRQKVASLSAAIDARTGARSR
jgi:serine/threonine protein kinase